MIKESEKPIKVLLVLSNELNEKIKKLKEHYGLNRTSLFRFLVNKEYNQKGFEDEKNQNNN